MSTHQHFIFVEEPPGTGKRVKIGSGMCGNTYLGWIEIAQRALPLELVPAAVGAAHVGAGTSDLETVWIKAALKEVTYNRDAPGYSLKKEAMLLGRIGMHRHPNIVQFLRFFYDADRDQTPILATLYISGDLLGQHLIKAVADGSVHTRDWQSKVLVWGAKLTSALEYLRSIHIVHRDIAPTNIVISNETGEPVLIDFGIGRLLHTGHGPTTAPPTKLPPSEQFKSPAYASPEQFCPGQDECPVCREHNSPCEATIQSDVYSLGAVLWHALAGRPAFSNADGVFPNFEQLGTIKSTTSADVTALPDFLPLRELLARMLSARPEDRPSAREAGRQLRLLSETLFQEHVADTPTDYSDLEDDDAPDVMPAFAPLPSGAQIATTLVSQYAAIYLRAEDADRIDFDSSNQEPAHCTYDEAVNLIARINDEHRMEPWTYRLPTVDEWFVAAGFPLDNSHAGPFQKYRRLLNDIVQPAGGPAEWEWCDAACAPEAYPEDCRMLCFLSSAQPAKGARHQRWPKGTIRLVREHAMVARHDGGRPAAPEASVSDTGSSSSNVPASLRANRRAHPLVSRSNR